MLASPSLAGTWRDDFEDGNLDGWEVFNPIPAEKWGVEDGECSGEWQNADPGMFSVLYLMVENADSWKDYTVKFKMKFVATGHFTGMSFRENLGRSYGFVIDTAKNTAWAWKFFQGVNTFPSEIPLPFTLSKDTWYELKIIVEGDNFEFYIDGKPAGEFEDNSIPSGKVGLYVRNAHAHFDDVVITGPEIPDGGSWKTVEPKGKLATSWGKLKTGY